MLDSETKRKIDSLRQILVGKVPDPKAQVEQITTALIYKFMDDMDQDSEETGGKATFFSGDFAKYSWSKLLDPKLGGHDRLNLYVEAITSMSRNSNIPQLFRDIFKDAFLPYRDPSTLNMFLKEANEFNYSDSESLGDAYEYLLSIMSSQGDAGQFRTPRHIIDFIVEVVDPKKDETILDPACGTAGFLISTYKHILSQHDGVDDPNHLEKSLTPDERKRLMNNVVGYDISPDMVRISLVNLYLHGFPEPKIFEYDTLSSEEKWDETYNCIMANPPFMTPKGGIRPHKRFSVQANRAEVLFVDYIVEHLKLNGRAGIIVPEGIIFQSANAYKQLRKKLVEDGLFCVVSLPAGVFNPYSGVKTSILFFANQLAKKSKDILFIKISNDGFDLGAQRKKIEKNDLTEALEIIKKYQSTTVIPAQAGIQTLAISKDKIAASGDYNLSADRYRETIDLKTQKWPMVELGEIAQFIRGITFSAKDHTDDNKNFVLVATTKAAQSDGLRINDLVKVKPSVIKKEETYLISGDILISVANSANLLGRKTFIKELPAKKYSFGAFMGLLRPNKDKILPELLNAFLSTSRYKEFCLSRANTTTNISNLNWSDLSKFNIPLPPLEIQKQIVEEIEGYQKIIDGAKQVISNWKPKIDIDLEWPIVNLPKLTNITTGKLNANVACKDGQYPFFTCSKEVYRINSYSFDCEALLLAGNNATADYDVKYYKGKFDAYQRTYVITIKNLDEVLYEYLKINLEYKLPELKSKSIGNLTKYLTLGILNNLEIPLPTLEIQKQIVEKIEEEQKIVEGNKRLVEIYEGKVEKVINEI